jgi:hypothetical protein
MPRRYGLVGEPNGEVAPPDQSRIVFRPVRHPISGLGDLVTAVSVEFVRHQLPQPRAEMSMDFTARLPNPTIRPKYNPWYIHAPTPSRAVHAPKVPDKEPPRSPRMPNQLPTIALALQGGIRINSAKNGLTCLHPTMRRDERRPVDQQRLPVGRREPTADVVP